VKINADAIETVNGGVMELAVVDGGVVLVPLLGFVDVFGGDEHSAFDPAPIGVIGHGGRWRGVGGMERRGKNEENRTDSDAEDEATDGRGVLEVHDGSDAGILAGVGALSNARCAFAIGKGPK
jgi:hypothetical protein